jgi:hypothetical protein
MQQTLRFRQFIIALLLATAMLSQGCGLFKKCGGCPSFSKQHKPSQEIIAANKAPTEVN